MSVKVEPSGRRSIQVEVEVPGTPEEVWQAIATGPGISAWFVPTEMEGREGGKISLNFGPGMDSEATITAWQPPHRFAAESPAPTPEAPPLGTEWIVEARQGGTCVVRVVHSFFASTADWDDQLIGTESGWPAFFRILRLYLTHFKGQPSALFQAAGVAAPAAWESLAARLGLDRPLLGEPRSSPEDAPPFAGTVEALGSGKEPYVLLLLDEPAPGAAFVSSCPMGEQVMISIYFYLYGERARDVAAAQGPRWEAWLAGQLPSQSAASS
jgi:uncharacterized protein YndB with AHSA1/START domain